MLTPWAVASIVALFVLVVAPAIATAQSNDEAQCLKPEAPQPQESPPLETPPPPFKALVFNGDVTVGGSAPSRQGYTITARIGRYWDSTAVPVGVGSGCGNMHCAHLIVNPPEELDLLGSQIQFWLNGQVRSVEHDWYSAINLRYPLWPSDAQWSFPILRQLDLEFPALPDDYQLDASLPATGSASPGKPMFAAFLLIDLLATISGLVAARRW